MKKFEKPRFIIDKDKITSNFGSFTIAPLEEGFGTTLGTALRRVLLSSLPGMAVYAIKVEGARHEYSLLPGVLEDLTKIILNIKQLVLKNDSDIEEECVLRLDVKGSNKEVTAGDIFCPDLVEVVNKDLVLCHLADEGQIKMTLFAHKGRGFVTSEMNKDSSWEIGKIAIDSNYSPIVKVKLGIEPDRVGHDASYEKLNLEVTTDGSMSPDDAVALASKILDEHFKLFEDLNDAVKGASIMSTTEKVGENKYASISLEDLDLSVRSYNCLKRNGLKTVQDLCNMKESELMTVRNLGKKSYKEILDKLASFNLSLQKDEGLRK